MSTAKFDETTLPAFLDAFYAKVRRDPVLAPVFDAAIPQDAWPAHMQRIGDFWSSVLFRSGRYQGNPFGRHVGKGIGSEHFVRWLALFEETAAEHFVRADASVLCERAHRIADSLRAGLLFRPGSEAPVPAKVS